MNSAIISKASYKKITYRELYWKPNPRAWEAQWSYTATYNTYNLSHVKEYVLEMTFFNSQDAFNVEGTDTLGNCILNFLQHFSNFFLI